MVVGIGGTGTSSGAGNVMPQFPVPSQQLQTNAQQQTGPGMQPQIMMQQQSHQQMPMNQQQMMRVSNNGNFVVVA